jgi:hypothetical protein
VVVVEQHDEDPHVVPLGLGLLVVGRADRPRRSGAFVGRAGDLHELERLDGLWLVVLEDLEVGLLQVGDGLALSIADDDVDADEVDAGPEDRRHLLPFAGRRRLGRRGVLRGLPGRGARGRFGRRACGTGTLLPGRAAGRRQTGRQDEHHPHRAGGPMSRPVAVPSRHPCPPHGATSLGACGRNQLMIHRSTVPVFSFQFSVLSRPALSTSATET